MPEPASPENAPKPQAAAPQPAKAGQDGSEPAFQRKKWMKLFMKGETAALCEEFIRVLRHYAANTCFNLSVAERAFVNEFVESFLYFFCHPDFKLPVEYVQRFLAFHPVISNLVAMSDYRTTTPWVIRLARRKENYFKLLVLHNARTELDIDVQAVFDVSPLLGSMWWTMFWLSVPAYVLRETHERIRRHLLALDLRFMIHGAGSRGSYFPVTYVAPEHEQVTKERLNTLVARAFENVKIRNKPDRKKIALASGRWRRSAVYTSLGPLIKTLRGRYDITLIHYGADESKICDRDMFERLIPIKMKNDRMDLEPLQDNEFSAVIFPDVGMDPESVFLSAIRIAPVQIVMYGHPSSTWSPEIDYFIGGRRVEVLENAGKNYSERLVVLPGMGVYPEYSQNFNPPPAPPPEEPFVINCGWTAQKVTWPLAAALQEVLRRARRNVIFQIFSGNGAQQNNGFIPFVKDVRSLLGQEHVRIMSSMARLDYLAMLCNGQFSIDSWPFGGFNTIIDALYCKKPVVAWQGDRAFSRFTAATLEIIGMPDLIARSAEEYIDLVVRLINDDAFRREMIAKVASIDLRAAIAKEERPEYFLKAVDYLIENHERLKAEESREPIVIA